ncbi:MAG: hypothetical protein PHS59_02645 [Paludibacter sp.]|nr:hypothetical protein [Paludibacter sp.]
MVQLIIFFIAFGLYANAQKSGLIGSWLLVKYELGNEIQRPYQTADFKEGGIFCMMGIDVGTWDYDKKSNAIVLKSSFDKDFNGTGKILKLNKDELEMDKAGGKHFYKKLDKTKIVSSNKNSGLIGTWEFITDSLPEVKTIVILSEPDVFKIVVKEAYSKSIFNGTWIFDKQRKSLIMIGLHGEGTFHGDSKIIKYDKNSIVLESKSNTYTGKRVMQNSPKIERLTFTEEDFYTQDGEYKYEADKEKLPWKGWEEKRNSLIPVKQLVYNYAVLINGTEAFNNKILMANVRANLEYDELHIDYIFNGFDRYNVPEDNELYLNDEYSLPLYPLYDQIFRISASESVTTPAGTFDCTVLETINPSGIAKKLWLINDKPGIYAKIIEDNPDKTFGHYYVYELQEIK